MNEETDKKACDMKMDFILCGDRSQIIDDPFVSLHFELAMSSEDHKIIERIKTIPSDIFIQDLAEAGKLVVPTIKSMGQTP